MARDDIDDERSANPPGDLRGGAASSDKPHVQGDDPKVIEALEPILDFFRSQPDEVFYEHQLEVIFEGRFWHWITSKALARLVDTKKLARDQLPFQVGENTIQLTFYRLPRHRYWRRKASEIIELVQQFSTNNFTRALGKQGEMLFDSGMAKAGFVVRAQNVREWNGRRWHKSARNLDRIYERDGIQWGAEIKNSLSYIEPDELQDKVNICKALGLRPLFIVRMAPGDYAMRVKDAGGFVLMFKYQFYPYGFEAFGEKVRTRLSLPIGFELADRTVKRFVDEGHLPYVPKAD